MRRFILSNLSLPAVLLCETYVSRRDLHFTSVHWQSEKAKSASHWRWSQAPACTSRKNDENASSVAAATLDALFGASVTQDRPLLKLDLQGYELHALRGGTTFLRSVEVILTEVSFFAQAYEPPIASLISFLNDSGFQLYEIASLAGRSRDNRLKQGDFVFVRVGSQLLQDGRWE